jgi:hypothetical protein|tara:strand:+ start:2158 stop:2511 length:354 start_codon:yes stop_codon:yes gene_type:complete
MPGVSKAIGALSDTLMSAIKRLNQGINEGDAVTITNQNLTEDIGGLEGMVMGLSPDGTVATVGIPKMNKAFSVSMGDIAPKTDNIDVDDKIQELLKMEEREPGSLNELMGETVGRGN